MHRIKNTSVKSKRKPAALPGLALLLKCVADTFQLLETWRLRHQSSMQLARVESRTLRDIGISESRRFVEVNKPFWEK